MCGFRRSGWRNGGGSRGDFARKPPSILRKHHKCKDCKEKEDRVDEKAGRCRIPFTIFYDRKRCQNRLRKSVGERVGDEEEYEGGVETILGFEAEGEFGS